MSLFQPRAYLLHLLDIVCHARRRIAQRPAIIRVALLGVFLEAVDEEVRVAVEKHVGLLVVSLCGVDLGLGDVSGRIGLGSGEDGGNIPLFA